MKFTAATTALLLVDLQNDFLHPDGAYGRAGLSTPQIAALPARLASLVGAARAAGVVVASTHFTLVPGRGGEPIVSQHLAALRPFLARGDFKPGAWGHALVDELGTADISVDKVVYSAFAHTRLDWMLQRLGITQLIVGGIVTNGGVASTIRDAHARDYSITLLADGCAAFDPAVHDASVVSLGSVVSVSTCAAVLADMLALPHVS